MEIGNSVSRWMVNGEWNDKFIMKIATLFFMISYTFPFPEMDGKPDLVGMKDSRAAITFLASILDCF